MTTVQEAEAALTGAINRKNNADSALVDALASETDVSAQLGRLVADAAPAKDIGALRKQRDQATQDVQDLALALKHLDADVATARQAVHQARQAEARATMREQAPALRDGADRLEEALQAVATWSKALITAGSLAGTAAKVLNQPLAFAASELIEATLKERVAVIVGGTVISGQYTAPVPDTFAALVADAEVLGTEAA